MSNETKRSALKIMFIPQEMAGHVSATLGLAQVLRSRGHQVIYAIDSSHRELAARQGFRTQVIVNRWIDGNQLNEWESKIVDELQFTKPKTWRWFMRNIIWKLSSIFKFITIMLYCWYNKDYGLYRIIRKHKPDIIVVDDLFCYPSVIYSGLPWVWHVSVHPLGFYDDPNLPQPYLGLSDNSTKTLWQRLCGLLYKSLLNILTYLYKLGYLLRGYPPNPENRHSPHSPYLNLYCYPRELDYYPTKTTLKYPNAYRLDTMWLPKYDTSLEKPIDGPLKQFIDESQGKKLILVSMGSYCSGDQRFMQKLIDILKQTEHRYIVVKGYKSDSYELPENMWGQPFVPQRQLLKYVDLLVTHAGTNSVYEALIYGRPMLALPLFLDQFDSAQRLHETGYGIRLDAHQYTDRELLDSLDQLLATDSDIHKRLKQISKRLLESDGLEIAAKMIENL
ncbi:UDP-glucuronosyltransferase 3A1-like [Oppia nitens]|uniref:UDP-glucuronosyltransferase 3A1-like n=1 Tax=Oppia nitens TaxID=1686743 RepID=UPI0023DBD7E1|nr:UDP-glucuronosyltransferase 3A1-like [Oppia nitens]